MKIQIPRKCVFVVCVHLFAYMATPYSPLSKNMQNTEELKDWIELTHSDDPRARVWNRPSTSSRKGVGHLEASNPWSSVHPFYRLASESTDYFALMFDVCVYAMETKSIILCITEASQSSYMGVFSDVVTLLKMLSRSIECSPRQK